MMRRMADTTLLIGPDLLVLGLAARLREQGGLVQVRGDSRHDFDSVLNGAVPSAIIVDLLVARRDDFLALRRLRGAARFAHVPIIVLSTGTLGAEQLGLEARLRSFDARPLLTPHDIEDVVVELERSRMSVA